MRKACHDCRMIDTAHGSASGGDAAADTNRTDHEVIIVGAGFAGIGAAIKLGEAGFDYLVLEKATEFGGVWRENTYPDCACDVPSAFYSFSFAPKPDWSHFFAHQEEIKRYAADTAESFGVTRSVRFGCELFAARWHGDSGRWRLETSTGSYTARFLILATGPMHKPVTPAIPGLESFPGTTFHSARWDHKVDLAGKRVAVIGTGASAIQFVPAIQPRVKHLTIFQRTAPWVLPKLDLPVAPRWQNRFRRWPFLQRLLRQALYWQFEFLSWSLKHPRWRSRLEDAARRNAFRSIKNPELRARVVPDYAIGCKRILQSNTWYRALAKENVTVAVGVRGIDGNTIVASDGSSCEADVILFATGFQVSNPPIAGQITGASGVSLAEVWKGSPEAFLGTTVPDCPNLFMTLGPNLYTFSSAFVMIEAQLEYILSTLTQARAQRLAVLSVKPDLVARFNQELQSSLQTSVFNSGGCTSYFIDSNGRNSTNWPWTTLYLRRRLRRVKLTDYRVTPFDGSAGRHV